MFFSTFASIYSHKVLIVKRYTCFLLMVLFLCTGCELKLKPNEEDGQGTNIVVQRYDRLEARYLTTGDFSALQQMNTVYPMETRTLLEDVLKLGEVNDPEINSKFLNFYQDTTLQTVIADAEAQYATMNDLNDNLNKAFTNMEKMLPGLERPKVYAQIGALDQSIVIGEKMIGISLDKYLGEDYPLYMKFYNAGQRRQMTRKFIVPDCLSFYLVSIYPLKNVDTRSQRERDLHMAKIMWLVNKAMEKNFFKTPYVSAVERYVKHHPHIDFSKFLASDDYTVF